MWISRCPPSVNLALRFVSSIFSTQGLSDCEFTRVLTVATLNLNVDLAMSAIGQFGASLRVLDLQHTGALRLRIHAGAHSGDIEPECGSRDVRHRSIWRFASCPRSSAHRGSQTANS